MQLFGSAVKAWYLFRHLCRIVRSDLNDLYDRQQVCLWCAGYSTIIVALCFMFAITLIIIGIIGEYISILFAEIKDRPIYIVHNVLNDDKAEKEEDTH